nr:hypothetical protein [uncultured Dyadobacter sp.]
MKGSKLTFALLALTGAVWGMILLRVIRTMANDQPLSTDPATTTEKVFSNRPLSDTFSLLPAYDDPFKGRVELTEYAPVAQASPVGDRPLRVVAERKDLTIPKPLDSAAVYLGLILNREKGRKVAVLRLNGHEHLLSEGQTVGGIRMVEERGDSLKVIFEHQTKWLRRSH